MVSKEESIEDQMKVKLSKQNVTFQENQTWAEKLYEQYKIMIDEETFKELQDYFDQANRNNTETINLMETIEALQLFKSLNSFTKEQIREIEHQFNVIIQESQKQSLKPETEQRASIYFGEFIELTNRMNFLPTKQKSKIEKLRLPLTFLSDNSLIFTNEKNEIVNLQIKLDYFDQGLNLYQSRIKSGYFLNAEMNKNYFMEILKKLKLKSIQNANKQSQINKEQYLIIKSIADIWKYLDTCQKYLNQLLEVKTTNILSNPMIGIIEMINMEFNVTSEGIENEKQNMIFQNPNQQKTQETIIIFDHIVQQTEIRKSALQLCGWVSLVQFQVPFFPFIESLYQQQNLIYENVDLNELCSSLEKEGKHYKSVAIAIFHFDFVRAFESIENIPSQFQSNESCFLKGILNGLKNIQQFLKQDLSLQKYFYQNNNQSSPSPSNKKQEQQQIKFDLEKLDKLQKDILYCEKIDYNFVADLQAIDHQQMRLLILKNSFTFLQSLCSNIIFSDPYLDSAFKFIANKSLNEKSNHMLIMEQSSISFFDKIAFGLRFLTNEELQLFFKSYLEEAKEKGFLEVFNYFFHYAIQKAIFLVGKNEISADILQAHLDKHNDIQTIGLISAVLILYEFPCQAKLKQWFNIYRQFLNKFKLYNERIKLDKEYQLLERNIQQILNRESSQLQTKQVKLLIKSCCYYYYKGMENSSELILKCFFCKCSLLQTDLLQKIKPIQSPAYKDFQGNQLASLSNCPNCGKSLPICSICLLSVSVINPYPFLPQFKLKKQKKFNVPSSLDMSQTLVWCQSCKHGGHFDHITEWFNTYNVCPVLTCNCQCLSL